MWQCARGVFIDRNKCWGYCVLESQTVLQSIDKVLLNFSFTGIDSLLLSTVFIIPLTAALITLLLLVRQNSHGLVHPTRNLLSTHKKNCLTSRLTPSMSHVGQKRVENDRGGRDGEKVRDGGMGATESVTAVQQAGVFSSTHLFVGIIHLKRDGGSRG